MFPTALAFTNDQRGVPEQETWSQPAKPPPSSARCGLCDDFAVGLFRGTSSQKPSHFP